MTKETFEWNQYPAEPAVPEEIREKNLRRLEYDKICAMLKDRAVSEPGKEKAGNLRPLGTLYEAKLALEETAEALKYLNIKSAPPLSGLCDIRGAVERAAVSAVLIPKELLQVARVISAIRQIKDYGKWERTEEGEYAEEFPRLSPYFTALNPPDSVEHEIRRCILGEDEISDNASVKLGAIRREILQKQEKIRTELQKMIHSQSGSQMLQDPVVTVKNGRFCLPVKSEYRGSFAGMIHDQSGSGSTLFIEPMAVVDLNNKITELYAAEEAEIERILTELSGRVAHCATELTADYSILVTLDFIFAKAKLASVMNASCPELSEQGPIRFPKARHPLIPEKQVVPITVYLGEGFTTLVITGPNTGGKTVTLKTLGLLCLMGQSGLFIPTSDGAQLRFLDCVFADIGDEQSIEQSLSTFSSHMKNIVEILANVTDRSLVLFDELGAGTDPTEGAALAQSILEQLRLRCVLTAATTHYSELKVYALSTEYVENASCEFDVDTLRPTYRLLIGVPGKSNAFAISRRLGLDPEIVENAAGLLEANDVKFEEMMTDLEIRRRQVEEEQEKIRTLSRQLAELEREQTAAAEKLEAQRDKILTKAREEARDYLKSAKAEADQSIARINKMILKGEKVDIRAMEQERARLREKTDELESKLDTAPILPKAARRKITEVSLGDRVRIDGFDQVFSVISKPDSKGRFQVQAGIMKMMTSLNDLTELLQDEEPSGPRRKSADTGITAGSFGKSASIRPEIDLRGMSVDEANLAIDKYLDDAALAGLEKVSLIHGKGTGALRKGIHEYLRRAHHVKSFHLGAYGEGDAGVTIVEIKK